MITVLSTRHLRTGVGHERRRQAYRADRNRGGTGPAGLCDWSYAMSFRVQFPDGAAVYINGLNSSVLTTYQQLEQQAIDLANSVGGQAFYENGLPRFQKDGVDLFPRWIPVGQPLSREQIKLTDKYNTVKRHMTP